MVATTPRPRATRALPTQEWFEAARSGNEEVIVRLLTEWPELITERAQSETALHYAAKGGHEKVVARLLAAPNSTQGKLLYWTTMRDAAARNDDITVVYLAIAGSGLISAVDSHGVNALHLAAAGGHQKVVAQLLTATSPYLVRLQDECNRSAFAFAALGEHEEVLSQLMNALPPLLDIESWVLHWAAETGRDNIVAQFLALRPDQPISELDADARTALRRAVECGQQQVAERLLAVNSDEATGLLFPDDKYTLLHAATNKCSREFVEKLWRMNPKALHVNGSDTPLYRALENGREDLVELFQWSCSLDEILAAFSLKQADPNERYKPVIEQQCERLLVSLGRDVVGIVFVFLGLTDFRKTKAERRNPMIVEPISMGG